MLKKMPLALAAIAAFTLSAGALAADTLTAAKVASAPKLAPVRS